MPADPCTCEGLKRADFHCMSCHETFSTDANFERHRKGKYASGRYCVSPAAVGLHRDRHGRWAQEASDDRKRLLERRVEAHRGQESAA